MNKFGSFARALPARAQRAAVDLQELRRRRRWPGCCRRRWRWRSAAASRAAATTPARSTCSARRRRRAQATSPSPSRPLAAVRDRRPSSSSCPASGEDRRRLQAARRRSDRRPDAAVPAGRWSRPTRLPAYLEALTATRRGVRHRASSFAAPPPDRGRHRRRARPRMAGPAIRAWQIASALVARARRPARDHRAPLQRQPSRLRRSTQRRRPRAAPSSRAGATSSSSRATACAITRGCGTASKVVVADIYDPFHLEQLEQARDQDDATARPGSPCDATEVLNEQLRARRLLPVRVSEKQRDFWLGQLAGVGRINPLTYDDDESLESPDRGRAVRRRRRSRRSHARRCSRACVPGIGADDKVILWGGGVYNWFDPLTLIRAVDQLRARRPERPAVLPRACKHPNPDVPEMRMAGRDPRSSPTSSGSPDTHVFFNEDWVDVRRPPELPARRRRRRQHAPRPRRDRVLVPHPHPRLPVGRPAGGRHRRRRARRADRQAHGLGLTVPPGDVAALARPRRHTCSTRTDRAARQLSLLRPSLGWSQSLGHFFASADHRDARRTLSTRWARHEIEARIDLAKATTFREDWRKARLFFAEGGSRELARKFEPVWSVFGGRET